MEYNILLIMYFTILLPCAVTAFCQQYACDKLDVTNVLIAVLLFSNQVSFFAFATVKQLQTVKQNFICRPVYRFLAARYLFLTQAHPKQTIVVAIYEL